MSQIEPRTLKGFRDSLPETEISRQKLIQKIRASYEAFGFEPLETPVLEYADILAGKYGEEGEKLMYRFKDHGERDVAMRYDLTIPLARVIAQYGNDIKKPFKRYQISQVWRADKPQKGRYRELYQCDADIVGSTSPLADAEILALSATTLRRLGIADFVIRVNSREIISAFYTSLGLSADMQVSATRAVDKIDKIGRAGVAEELKKYNFSAGNIDSILAFAETSLDCRENWRDMGALEETFPAIKESLNRLAEIIGYALELVPDVRFVIDLSIARGLDYYTGIIFETNLTKAPEFGSVMSGGRYDNLVGMFANKPVPALGTSIGLDRLIAALEELKLIQPEKTTAQALIVNFDEALVPEYLKLAGELREAGINTILYFETADMKKQLSYASDKGIKFALIYGQNEAKEGKIMLKNLEKGTQEKIGRGEVAARLKNDTL